MLITLLYLCKRRRINVVDSYRCLRRTVIRTSVIFISHQLSLFPRAADGPRSRNWLQIRRNKALSSADNSIIVPRCDLVWTPLTRSRQCAYSFAWLIAHFQVVSKGHATDRQVISWRCAGPTHRAKHVMFERFLLLLWYILKRLAGPCEERPLLQ